MRNRGFTLIEVSLAIVIGVIVLAGAILLYNQVKTSAGNATASDKVMALQALVEEMEAKNYRLPTPPELYNNLISRRTDVDKNPWGGPAGGALAGSLGGSVGDTYFTRQAGFEGSDVDFGTVAPTLFNRKFDPNSIGMLVFYRGWTAADQPTNATIQVWDEITQLNVTAKRYFVGIVGTQGTLPANSGVCFNFVRSTKN